jgi:hypothetical protein
MPFTSPYPSLTLPQTNILSYLFPPNQNPSDEPLWFDSKNDRECLSPKELLLWVKRLSFGLERLGLEREDVVMICTTNQIFVPVAYLGIVGAGYCFSGSNPAYTIPGKPFLFFIFLSFFLSFFLSLFLCFFVSFLFFFFFFSIFVYFFSISFYFFLFFLGFLAHETFAPQMNL